MYSVQRLYIHCVLDAQANHLEQFAFVDHFITLILPIAHYVLFNWNKTFPEQINKMTKSFISLIS